MEFWRELTMWVFAGVAFTLFVKSMNGLLPIATAKLPLPDGLKQAITK